MNTTVYVCRDNPDNIFTGIYDAWASKKGHAQVRIQLDGEYTMELFCDYINVVADPLKADKVIRSIKNKISPEAWQMVFRAVMSCDKDKGDAIYRFLIGGFHYGPPVIRMLAEPAVQKIFELDRMVGNEAHFYREFLRFDSMEKDILMARIRPKNNVLVMLTPHFADRLSGENFMIVDVGRGLAAIHPADRDWYLTTLAQEQTETILSRQQDAYRNLWKTFYKSIAIKERKNLKLQRNMMPIRYREFMPENEI